jgi:two-component system sensor histidine kinase DesK
MSDSGSRSDYRLSIGGPFMGGLKGSVGLGGALIWLAFIVFPVADAIARSMTPLRHVLVIAGAASFVVAYVLLVVCWRQDSSARVRAALFTTLIVIAAALTLGDRASWAFLFTYCAACAALLGPPPYGLIGVVLSAGLAGVTAVLAGASGGSAIGASTAAAGIGLLMLLMRDLRVRNDELSDARAELARLAVAQERERFARDLHDLLGHTLSVIALKAELAGRLLPSNVADAGREIADVEEVARTALTEVREAVSGYRQPTLDGELAGAKLALTAARIEVSVRRAAVALDPAVEAVLAWSVREGATNVIRHSGASRCEIEIDVSLADATVEIRDDGGRAGAMSHSRNARETDGHGLDGLAERARSVHGTVEAGPRQSGGFQLVVRVPVAQLRSADAPAVLGAPAGAA